MSQSQVARINSERWVATHGYCLACDSDRLIPTPPNTPARDFECEQCRHPYELKAAAKPFGLRIVDGAYASMMRRIEEGTTASFLLMRYTPDWRVSDLMAVHHSLILPEMIEQRRPLSATARRAGWIGCNILLHQVPPEGRIALIDRDVVKPRVVSRRDFQKAERLTALPTSTRGWAAALLTRLHRFGTAEFDLKQVYALEHEMSVLFPNNQHVREKLRQQLQVLRGAGILTFKGRGRYQLTHTARHP